MKKFLTVFLLTTVWAGCADETKHSDTLSTGRYSARAYKTVKHFEKINSDLFVGTWNVNFGLGGNTEMIEFMGRSGAQIILLQETTPAWENEINRKLSKIFPHRNFHHRGGAGGIGVISKLPLKTVKIIDPPSRGWFPAMLVSVSVKNKVVQLLNVHLHPPFDDKGSIVKGYFSSPPIRLAEMKKYYSFLSSSDPVIIAGDFNEGTSGKTCSFLANNKFSRAAVKGNTWEWKTSYMVTLKSVLDHIFYRNIKLEGTKLTKTGTSDHFPLFAKFKL
ncbi:endonuclease/exonuclease/phosphatase family protein [Myxococcota bacterium]|nr:endonuclease/exonuclease/phosphatase family protein [Myxococcota bacterium]MBU1382458.1 endonuclease/exonuclease/phosphatase family protein [Myxococcota bacterium]MBU1495577.1 endonuclease/exonuclease/phosphatase family protein [Myxococcota bacterium]